MGRSVMLSNGQMLVGLNKHGLVHDFYYPYVGLENLTTARSTRHMIGIWVDGVFSWLDDNNWEIDADFLADALISNITAEHKELGIKLHFSDFIDTKFNAFCRRITVSNNHEHDREIRIFMHQVFQISNYGRADTVLYTPDGPYLYDYKGSCSLLIYSRTSAGTPFDQFSVGLYGVEGKEGTFRDAEDGELSGNLVEHGGVDSVMRCVLKVGPGKSDSIDYWVIASTSQHEAEKIHSQLLKSDFDLRLKSVREWWQNWLAPGIKNLASVPDKYHKQFKKSLLVIKAHIDSRGGIIASCDSSIYNYGRDYYSYVWTRDATLTLLPLIELGYEEEPKRFFEFCANIIHSDGYLMHKYQPDMAIGSTWHPLMHQNHKELAIQEDETAIVIYALCQYYKKNLDEKFIERMYTSLLKPAADFMASFVDESTALPHASYDLWEERFATHTYTVVVTKAALLAAAEVADHLNHPEKALNWRRAAESIDNAMKLLFDPSKQVYRKSVLLLPKGDLEFNSTVDASSLYGIMSFDPTRRHSDALAQTALAVEKSLHEPLIVGGVARYEGDKYFMSSDNHPGNPWLICGLWLAQYYIFCHKFSKAELLIEWVAERASPSGMFPEQVSAEDGSSLSVQPLVWSHASFIETLMLLAQEEQKSVS